MRKLIKTFRGGGEKKIKIKLKKSRKKLERIKSNDTKIDKKISNITKKQAKQQSTPKKNFLSSALSKIFGSSPKQLEKKKQKLEKKKSKIPEKIKKKTEQIDSLEKELNNAQKQKEVANPIVTRKAPVSPAVEKQEQEKVETVVTAIQSPNKEDTSKNKLPAIAQPNINSTKLGQLGSLAKEFQTLVGNPTKLGKLAEQFGNTKTLAGQFGNTKTLAEKFGNPTKTLAGQFGNTKTLAEQFGNQTKLAGQVGNQQQKVVENALKAVKLDQGQGEEFKNTTKTGNPAELVSSLFKNGPNSLTKKANNTKTNTNVKQSRFKIPSFFKTPSFLKTKSAKKAQKEKKEIFGNMDKAPTLLAKHTAATKAVDNTKKELVNKKTNLKTQKDAWKKENNEREAADKVSKAEPVPPTKLGKVGKLLFTPFKYLGTKIVQGAKFTGRNLKRGAIRTGMFINRSFTKVKTKIAESQKKSAENKMDTIMNQSGLEKKGTMENKEKAISKAFEIKKEEYKKTQIAKKQERNSKAKAKEKTIKNTKDQLEVDYQKQRDLKQEYLKIKNSKDPNYITIISEIKKKQKDLNKEIKTKQKEIQTYDTERFEAIHTFESLDKARQKSIFSGKSKRLRKQSLEQKSNETNFQNSQKAALVKIYRTPKYQKKAAKTKATFNILKTEGKIKDFENINSTKPISEIKEEIKKSSLNSKVKATLIAYYKNEKVKKILNENTSQKAKPVVVGKTGEGEGEKTVEGSVEKVEVGKVEVGKAVEVEKTVEVEKPLGEVVKPLVEVVKPLGEVEKPVEVVKPLVEVVKPLEGDGLVKNTEAAVAEAKANKEAQSEANYKAFITNPSGKLPNTQKKPNNANHYADLKFVGNTNATTKNSNLPKVPQFMDKDTKYTMENSQHLKTIRQEKRKEAQNRAKKKAQKATQNIVQPKKIILNKNKAMKINRNNSEA
jgi:hypothetical protein